MRPGSTSSKVSVVGALPRCFLREGEEEHECIAVGGYGSGATCPLIDEMFGEELPKLAVWSSTMIAALMSCRPICNVAPSSGLGGSSRPAEHFA